MASREFAIQAVTALMGCVDHTASPFVPWSRHLSCANCGFISAIPVTEAPAIQFVRRSSRRRVVCGCRRESALAGTGVDSWADVPEDACGAAPGRAAGVTKAVGASTGGTAVDSACRGTGKDNTTRTGANSPSASLASRGATDTSTYPEASSEPSTKGRAGFPSTDIKATPLPPTLAITPDRTNRSAGPGPGPAATGAEAPSNRASSTGLETSVVVTGDGASTKTGPPAASPTCVQYHPDMATLAQTTAVAIRQPIALCSLDITVESSHSDALFRHPSQGLASSFLTRNQVCRSMARGFTLIELMVVLVIIGVLAALIVPNVLDRADDARVMAARTDVNNLNQALKLYKLDNQRLPNSEQGLQALITKPTVAPVPINWKAYLDKLPNDPWGRPYQYLNPGIKGEVDVMSLGADGQPGGEGRNADIGSWQ